MMQISVSKHWHICSGKPNRKYAIYKWRWGLVFSFWPCGEFRSCRANAWQLKKNGNDHAEASQSAWTKLYAARASCTQIQKDLALGTKFIGSLAPTPGGGPAGGGG